MYYNNVYMSNEIIIYAFYGHKILKKSSNSCISCVLDKDRLIGYSMTVFAGILYSIALKYFVLPSKVILTGTEGISSALSYYYDSYWLFIILYLLFQIFLLSFAFFKVGKVFAVRSFVVVITVVVFLLFLPELKFASPEPQNERIILVVFGGILAGTAKAIAFQNRGSTGDEDIIGAFYAMKYLKPVGLISVCAATVSTVFGLSMEYLKIGNFEEVVNTLMYTCIYIFASAETLNNIYRKFKITMITIVTNKYEEVGKAINSTFSHRTYTIQQGIGGHSGEATGVVKSIITHEELPQIIDAIKSADPISFYYYHDVEGISSHYYIKPIG